MTEFLLIVGYLGLLLLLGLASNFFFRGTSSDYFLVSRSVGPVLLLLSVFGTTMTGFALVGSTGKAYTTGIGVYGLMASWSGLIHSAVFFLIGIKLWAIGKRYGYMTQCAYFRDRFESPALSYMLFPILVLLVVPYLLVGVIGAGKSITPFTKGAFPDAFPVYRVLQDGTVTDQINPALHGGIPFWLGAGAICLVVLFYIFFGGLRGAVWANAFQTVVFMTTGIIAFYMVADSFGSASEASAAVANHSDPEVSERLARGSQIGHMQFFSYCFIPLSVGMFPHLFQHWLTAKSAKSFRLTVIAHPIFIAIVWAPCILIGIWAAAKFGTGVPNPNSVLGRVISEMVHSHVLSGLVAAGVLAAIMSSLDSQFVCLGTMFTTDVVDRIAGKGRFTDHQRIWISRAFILTIVLLTYLLALLLQNSAHVFDLGVWCFSGFASLFPVVFAAVYWKRATRAGAVSSVVVTGVVWSVLFVNDMIAKANAAPGGGEDEALIYGMMPVTFIFASSVITLIVVSLLTRPPSQATIDKFFPKALQGLPV